MSEKTTKAQRSLLFFFVPLWLIKEELWRVFLKICVTEEDYQKIGLIVSESMVNRDQPIADIKTMEQRFSELRSVSEARFRTFLLSIFAAVALVLAAVGIYGVLSYSVSQRTNEIGIRVALGVQKSDILRLVLKQGLLLTLIGVGIGLVASFAVTRIMSSLLFNVSATDPATFIVISLLLSAVALLACLIPARRATRVDPMVALRYE